MLKSPSKSQFKVFVSLIFFMLSIKTYGQDNKADSLERQIEIRENDTIKVSMMIELHDLYRLSDFKKAAKLAEQSFTVSKQIQWEKGIAITGRNFGIALNLLSKYDSANLVLKTAIEASRKIIDVENEAYCYLTLGNIQYDQTNYDKALEHYFTCYELYKSKAVYSGMSSALIWIGIIYQYAQDNFEDAIKTYQLALEYAELGKIGLNKSYIYSNLATIFYQQKMYDSSLHYYREGIIIKEKYNDVRGLANGLNNIGNCYYEMGELDSALHYYNISLEKRKGLGDQTGIATSYINLAKIYLDLDGKDTAREYIENGLKISEEINYKEGMQQATLLMSTWFEKNRQYNKALDLYKYHKEISDTIFNIGRDQIISELNTKYQTEQKESKIKLQQVEIEQKELIIQRDRYIQIGFGMFIALLIIIGVLLRNRVKHKQNLELERIKSQAREAQIAAVIASQENERNRFARDLHDTFGQLISILNMNIGSIKDSKPSPEKREEVFNASTAVLNDMYDELKNVCFDLMPQSLIKGGVVPALQEFAARINTAEKVFVETDFFGLDERLTELHEISLYRISQEWVNNILKYSDADKVTLQLTRDEDELTLLIEDNGSGFDVNKLTTGKGNGWKNIQSRANLVKGEVELDTVMGRNGNTLIMNCPVVKETSQVEKIPS